MAKKNEPETQQVNAKLPADTVNWLRGASVILVRDMADILDDLVREGLARLEKTHKRSFDRVLPRPKRK